MKRRLAMFLCVAILQPLLGGCGPEARDDILRRGNGGEPGTLDPALAEDVHAFNILVDLYEGLVTIAPDGTLIPGVADSWSVSGDGRTYTFKLRDSATWSNGDIVVADDFVRAFRHVASPDTASAYAFLLEPLLNFRGAKQREVPVTKIGAEAPDNGTLVLRLAEPTAHFLSVLSMPIAFPRHRDADTAQHFQRPETFIGNGAYVLRERRINGPISLQVNEYYRERGSVAIDHVVYLPTVDPVAELNMYRAGELHLTHVIPSNYVASLIEELPDEVRIAPSLALYYLAFDLSEAPLDNPLLRKALSMAIDRRQIVELTARGESPAYGVVPPGVANHVPARYSWQEMGDSDRVAMARQLFADAGFDSKTPLEIKITYDTEGLHERIALAIAAMWQDALGIDVRFEKLEWKLLLDTRGNRAQWQTMRFSWFGDYDDPMTFVEIFRSDSPQNLAAYANAEYDAMVDRASKETDPAVRMELMTAAERLLIEDYPIAPLYFYVSKHLLKPEVRGFENNALDRHPSRYLSIEKTWR